MYRVQLIQPQDRDLFNNFIDASTKPHFLQSYEWGELKAGTGWTPYRLLAWRHDRPVAAISLLKRRLPLFRRVGLRPRGVPSYCSIMYAPRGPILGEDCDQEGEQSFWQAVKELARQQGAIFIKIDPDIPEQPADAAGRYRQRLAAAGFVPGGSRSGFGGVQPRYVFRLDITGPEQELLAAMESKTRYNIHLAERKGVLVRVATDAADLRVFFEILTETAARDHFLIRNFSYFERIWELFVRSAGARIFLADYQGQAIAGTLAFHCGDRAWYLYGASSNRFRNVMPNYLLQWTMIRWAKELGCSMYDFRGVPGSDDPHSHLAGLYRFKKGFGACFTEFIGEYDLVLDPYWYFLWTRVLPVYQQAARRLLRRSSPRHEDSI